LTKLKDKVYNIATADPYMFDVVKWQIKFSLEGIWEDVTDEVLFGVGFLGLIFVPRWFNCKKLDQRNQSKVCQSQTETRVGFQTAIETAMEIQKSIFR